ncbi:hypothetical protein [Aestuariispira insulae]|uniref:hypothetical protein n=1 Tax=Aestuariispira insulae TaxID=1461337 RepID=UPI0011C06A87|nr:hypothetical protein [Aestuariispira insulae]
MAIATTLASDWYRGFQEFLGNEPEFAPLRSVFRLTPEQMADYDTSVEFNYNAIGVIHGVLNDELNIMLSRAFRQYVDRIAPCEARLERDWREKLQVLDQLGHCPMPPVASSVIRRLNDHFEKKALHVMQSDEIWHPVSNEEALRHNVARYERADILACPDVLEIATRPETIALIQAHLGVLPTLINLSCWRSHAGLPAPKRAQFFHFDLDDYRFCKLFVYLSDAGEGAGPHVYVEGSHRAALVRNARDHWPEGPKDFMDWYLKSVRKTDEDVEKAFGNAGVRLTGKAGDSFITNTAGIHKGEMPVDQDRFLLQMEFAATPMLTELIDPVPLADLGYPEGLAGRLNDPVTAYVARLFVTA